MPPVDSRSSSKTLFTSSSRNFKTIKFEDTKAARAPRIADSQGKATRPVSTTPSLASSAQSTLSPEGSARSSVLKRRSQFSEDVRRDSGMAPTISTVGHESVSEAIGQQSQTNAAPQNIPAIHLNDEPQEDEREKHAESDEPQANGGSKVQEEPLEEPHLDPHEEVIGGEETPDEQFSGINTAIPTGDLDDPFTSDELSFSKRGSVLWGGKKANAVARAVSDEGRRQASKGSAGSVRRFSNITLTPAMSRAQSRMSFDERRESQKVRSMYDAGDENAEDWSDRPLSGLSERNSELDHTSGGDTLGELPRIGSPRLGYYGDERCSSALSRRSSFVKREPWEAAGGIEDWRDVESSDVDRYGFIKTARNQQRSRGTSAGSSAISEELERPVTRESESQPVPDAIPRPRKLQRPQHSSAKRSSKANGGSSRHLYASRQNAPSVASSRSRLSVTPSVLGVSRSSRQNRGRRWANEAATMLTSAPGRPETAATSPDKHLPSGSTPLERKREAKWEKMAKHSAASHPTRPSKHTTPVVGGGESYHFDTSDPKVISRTWKGIPNRWRSVAWHSFLTSSAKKHSGHDFIPDDTLIDRYHALQLLDYHEDPQIDTDVPRTIGGHIMFRTRYRGGQRLLFRVLRALALSFPATGYVQGMAPLAATLLCYYDEERAYVMGVRMWECRGLRLLYSPGFQGLFAALDDFEKHWLCAMGEGVRDQLQELGVATSAFGTKWYLTLFCYTLPYEAQLRVWDVFMLLGNPKAKTGPRTEQKDAKDLKKVAEAHEEEEEEEEEEEIDVPEGQFDVLHAIAAALIDALQPTLLGTDFEGVMKAMTSHIPVGRADVLMNVARREWAEREKRARKSH